MANECTLCYREKVVCDGLAKVDLAFRIDKHLIALPRHPRGSRCDTFARRIRVSFRGIPAPVIKRADRRQI